MLIRIFAQIVGIIAALALLGCSGHGAGTLTSASSSAAAPALAQLENALTAELMRIGVDPAKAVAKAPGPGNAVFDLHAVVQDPDGVGPLPPTGVELSWTERCIGDYDQNGEVNAADLVPLGQHFGQALGYRSPGDAGGLEWWPTGNPDDDGWPAGTPSPPKEGSGALNWRLARIDGDFDSELGISDITPITMHWKERLDGYRIYRRGPGETEYQLLGNPDDPAAALTVPRSAAFPDGASSPDPHRPVRYHYADPVTGFGPYEYYVVAFDGQSGSEGSHSSSGTAQSNRSPLVTLSSQPQSGPAPLYVEFQATASDPDGSIVNYEWDFDGDGTWDAATGDYASAGYTYAAGGTFAARLRVTDNAGASAEASAEVRVSSPPLVVLTATPDNGTSPLSVAFDASSSSDPDGSIVSFDWDFDGDGTFDFNAGTTGQLQHIYPQGGAYHAQVRATDNDGLSATAVAVIRIDSPPVADIKADRTSGNTPLTVHFDASGSRDPGGEIISYEWAFIDGKTFISNTGTEASTEYTYTEYGLLTAAVRVTDSDGLTDTDWINISLNYTPSPGLTATPVYGTPPLDVSFDASQVDDYDSRIIAFDWDWEGDGVFDLLTRGPLAQHTYSTYGDYSATVKAYDEHGAYSTSVVAIDANAPPQGGWLSASPNPTQTGWLTDIQAVGWQDPDGQIASMALDLDNDGTYETSIEYGFLYNIFHYSGTYTVGLLVTDNQGASATATTDIIVQPDPDNQPPSLELTEFEPDYSNEQQGVSLTVHLGGQDSDGYVMQYEIDFDGDGLIDHSADPQQQSTFSFTYPPQYPPFTATFRAIDDDGVATEIQMPCDFNWEMHSAVVHNLSGLLNVQGQPALVGGLYGYSPLEYLRANESTGLFSTLPQNLDCDLAGYFINAGIINGKPAILVGDSTYSYYSVGYFSATDPLGESWNAQANVPQLGYIVDQCLAEVDGRPAIAFVRGPGGSYPEIGYIRADDAEGQQWNTPPVVFAGHTTANVDLAVLDGRPTIAYEELAYPSVSLNIARAADAQGSSWNAPVQVFSATGDEIWDSDRLILSVAPDGTPLLLVFAIKHNGNNPGPSIKLYRGLDPQGSSWSTSQVLADTYEYPCRGALTTLNGKLALVYGDPVQDINDSLHILSYRQSVDASGVNWGPATAFASQSQARVQATEIDGRLAVAYINGSGITNYMLHN